MYVWIDGHWQGWITETLQKTQQAREHNASHRIDIQWQTVSGKTWARSLCGRRSTWHTDLSITVVQSHRDGDQTAEEMGRKRSQTAGDRRCRRRNTKRNHIHTRGGGDERDYGSLGWHQRRKSWSSSCPGSQTRRNYILQGDESIHKSPDITMHCQNRRKANRSAMDRHQQGRSVQHQHSQQTGGQGVQQQKVRWLICWNATRGSDESDSLDGGFWDYSKNADDRGRESSIRVRKMQEWNVRGDVPRSMWRGRRREMRLEAGKGHVRHTKCCTRLAVWDQTENAVNWVSAGKVKPMLILQPLFWSCMSGAWRWLLSCGWIIGIETVQGTIAQGPEGKAHSHRWSWASRETHASPEQNHSSSSTTRNHHWTWPKTCWNPDQRVGWRFRQTSDNTDGKRKCQGINWGRHRWYSSENKEQKDRRRHQQNEWLRQIGWCSGHKISCICGSSKLPCCRSWWHCLLCQGASSLHVHTITTRLGKASEAGKIPPTQISLCTLVCVSGFCGWNYLLHWQWLGWMHKKTQIYFWWMYVMGVTPYQNVESDTGISEPELCRSRAIRSNQSVQWDSWILVTSQGLPNSYHW